MMKASPALAHYVYDFLENKAYSKGKGDFARKVRKFCIVKGTHAMITLNRHVELILRSWIEL